MEDVRARYLDNLAAYLKRKGLKKKDRMLGGKLSNDVNRPPDLKMPMVRPRVYLYAFHVTFIKPQGAYMVIVWREPVAGDTSEAD